MFQRLTKHTDSEHPDYSGCADSLKLVHNILVHLNCKEREALENGQREATLRELENVIEGISDLVANDRTILRFELVSMPSNTGGQSGRKERGIFLFNDLLVITSIKKRSGVTRKPNRSVAAHPMFKNFSLKNFFFLSMPGSFTSTLDTNKYKFLTRIPLEELDIVKCKSRCDLLFIFSFEPADLFLSTSTTIDSQYSACLQAITFGLLLRSHSHDM